eukprot:scaffold36176_cov68-Phaeocystis_antarctica.AAC.3
MGLDPTLTLTLTLTLTNVQADEDMGLDNSKHGGSAYKHDDDDGSKHISDQLARNNLVHAPQPATARAPPNVPRRQRDGAACGRLGVKSLMRCTRARPVESRAGSGV